MKILKLVFLKFNLLKKKENERRARERKLVSFIEHAHQAGTVFYALMCKRPLPQPWRVPSSERPAEPRRTQGHTARIL